MGRDPTERPTGQPGFLADRLRELRDRRDISAADKRRLETILGEIGNLGGIRLDDILRPERPGGPVIGPGGGPGTLGGDFKGGVIRPAQVSTLVAEAVRAVPRDVDPLDFVTSAVLGRIREELPDTLPREPIQTGRKGALVPVPSAALGTLVQLAAQRRTEGEPSIVWDDGVNQLMVHAGKVRSTVTEGMVRLSVPVECDQVKAMMEIAFAVGSGERVAGMIAATAERPAGDALIARLWGDALIAFAYGILLDLADSLAGASGRDDRNDRLVPRGLVARRGQLSVETQARFVYERSGS